MKCPRCGCKKTKIIDTRAHDAVIVRVRMCEACEVCWTTNETLDECRTFTLIISKKVPR